MERQKKYSTGGFAGIDCTASLKPNKWRRKDGKAKDIGAGADGSVWIVSALKVEGGNAIYKWVNGWERVPGRGGVTVTVGHNLN